MIHEKNTKQKISWHCPFKTETAGSGTVVLFAAHSSRDLFSIFFLQFIHKQSSNLIH